VREGTEAAEENKRNNGMSLSTPSLDVHADHTIRNKKRQKNRKKNSEQTKQQHTKITTRKSV
jgi:hypothetical protein